jgi:signal transduction histidine kinase/CheY-like chemotaxis protein
VINLHHLKLNKLGTKTGLIALSLFLVILLGEGLFSWSHSRIELNRNFETESHALTAASAEAMNLPLWDLDVETLQIMTDSLAENPNIISVTVKDPSGKIIAERYNEFVDVVDPLKVNKDIHANYERHSSNLGTLLMNFSRAGVQKELKHTAMVSAIRGLISSVFLFAVMFWIIRSLVKPIEALEKIISEYDGRTYIDHVQGEDRKDELGSLAQGFKRMASQISGNLNTLEERVAARTVELNKAVIKASAANKAKTEFLANMSHEIRTPLNGVLGMLDVLRRTSLTQQQLYYTDIINKSGNNLLTILSDILDLSKIEAGKETLNPTPCDLKSLINETVNLFAASASEKKLDLTFEYDPKLTCHYLTDMNRVRQILSNLIGNAIKFTPEGSVSVNVTGTTKAEHTHVEISVKDTGIGIKQDKIDLIFEKFTQAENSTTRRFGGTGLGLTISRKLAHALGGEIRVTSEPGRGTTFVIHLPLKCVEQSGSVKSEDIVLAPKKEYSLQKAHLNTPPKESPLTASKAALNILIVEDDLYNTEVIKSFLAHPKIQLTIAVNGLEAVNLHGSQWFDVIFMDVSMPVMDGLKATQIIRDNEIKTQRERTPIICLSAHVMEDDRKKFLKSGMDDYLAKPLNRKALLEVTSKWLKISKVKKSYNQPQKTDDDLFRKNAAA